MISNRLLYRRSMTISTKKNSRDYSAGVLHVNPVGDENLRDLFGRATSRGHTHQNRKKDMELLHIRGTLSIVLFYWFCSVLPCGVFCDKLEKNLQGSDRMSLREKLLRVAPEAWEDEFVRIRPMATRDDLIYAGDGCRLTDEQREFVNPVWFSLGRAYLAPEDHDPCLIENERREPIGFLCFTAWADAYSWSYFLDVRQQGRGYGKRAAQLALRLLRLADPDMPVKLAVEAANTRAQRLYRSLGFRQLPERDGDDLIFCMEENPDG